MALDPSTPRSRRAILAAAAGAAAATVVGAVTRPSTVRAAGDDASIIHIGDFYADARSQTTWSNQSTNDIVLWVASNADAGGGGGTALVGYSDHGIGVQGQSASGLGVRGISSTNHGVYGSTSGGMQSIGVYGSATSGAGVSGTSDSYVGVKGTSGSYIGLLGQSTNYTGIQGIGPSYGVAGQASAGVGVAGEGSLSGVQGYSLAGSAIYGWNGSASGWAGNFQGRVLTTGYHQMQEISNPTAPGLNRARLYLRDNGSGKTQLCVRFNTGAIQVLATQP